MRLFDSIAGKRPGRNKFDLTHEKKMSFLMGKLVPILCNEIVPGDNFRVTSEIMLRFAPLLAPIMHRVNVFTHYFFVPNRLVWSEWEDFITGGRLGTSTPIWPHITVGDTNSAFVAKGSLGDYLGLPTTDQDSPDQDINVSALPFRAYQKIWDEYYRDQNLTADLDMSIASGQVTGGELSKLSPLRSRCWEKDYFTSALPFAQRGSAVSMPIDVAVDTSYEKATGLPYTTAGHLATDNTGQILGGTGPSIPVELRGDQSFTTINDLRRSIKLQEWLEKNARGGARYIEQILSHFGVRSSDARLQRPEYLGGGKTPVQISEVLSTYQSVDGEGVPQANMAGHAAAYGTRNGFKKTFEEHGFVIGIMSVLPKTAYQQGIHRMWSRDDKFDYYWPEFANIGEQEIKNKEIYWNVAAATTPEGTFGYQSRYAEYKYEPSTVHGEFKADLAYWHMGRIFSSTPALNETFVTADPTNRIFPVNLPTTEHMYAHILNRVDALRPMPYYGTPSL